MSRARLGSFSRPRRFRPPPFPPGSYPADAPGAAAIVVVDGEVVLRKGYGLANVELQVPNRPEMVFELGSVTKQFTAAAILMLAERGQLRIEEDVTKYLPDYPTHGRKITIEHLLTHTSGIPSYTSLPEWIPRMREDIRPETLIGFFKDKPLEFEPGERWAYNNSGYVLLGAVIEKVSGKSYEQFIEEEIFKPLGMKDSPATATWKSSSPGGPTDIQRVREPTARPRSRSAAFQGR
jgi:D-alanyl-D-alanine carboxypeptidase